MKYVSLALAITCLLYSTNSFAFGRKKMHVAELKGVTESQVATIDGKASILVRGKAAELVFRMLKQQQEQQNDSPALQWLGSGTHITIKGRQINCSKIVQARAKAEDFACAFNLDTKGNVASGVEAFSPNTFNLARTQTPSKIFRKNSGRSLASVVAPTTTFSTGLAYLVYDEPGKQQKSENALIVFRGDSAKDIMALLETDIENKSATWGEGRGRKGNEIACVGATLNEPDRCALVVSFRDGSVTRSGNPLFR